MAGEFLRDVVRANPRTFRVIGPDETASNRLGALFEATDRACGTHDVVVGDDHLAPDGRVMEVLSEHLCQGCWEGYLLTGRHGVFNCYEAFIHIVDPMLNQHAKWLKVTRGIPWRRPIASLNYLLSSSTSGVRTTTGSPTRTPGFIDIWSTRRRRSSASTSAGRHTLLSTLNHCLRSRDYFNIDRLGQATRAQPLAMDDAVLHCTRGLGIWDWAGNDNGDDLPDVVVACAGTSRRSRRWRPWRSCANGCRSLWMRVVNVVDPHALWSPTPNPRRAADAQFDALFTTDRPVGSPTTATLR